MTASITPEPPEQPTAPIPPAPSAPVAATSEDTSTNVAKPARRSRTRAYLIGGLAVVFALCCGGVGIIALSGDDADPVAQAGARPSSTAPSTPAPSTVAPTTAPAPTTAAYDSPTKKDFNLGVKILKKKCFGSAGCNITYRIDVTYIGAGLDPSKTYEVTYEVRGGEDPMVNTFEVTGDTASVQQEEDGGTKRSTDKLTAVVTDVAEL
ncbi:hypothetical protein [Micromonospora sp. NPDC048839]|uniref:hypothetical protein n=1 Tax=Micromonospora sp. NPDC048839 TaxID=3155641 RepID=UPI00340AC912